MLLNLLGNACKFTEAGTITVSAKMNASSGSLAAVATVSVRAEGWIQRDATQRFWAYALAAVGPGVGSTFSMRVPSRAVVEETVDGRQPVPTESPPPAPRETGTPPVVVIDDDADARELLSWLLTRQRLHPILCSSGGEGLEAIRQHRPVAITLDVQMDGTDGWTVLETLKKDPELADIPVIMVSVVDEAQRGREMGAFDYLTKPLNTAAFTRAVHRCVKGNKAAGSPTGPREARYA